MKSFVRLPILLALLICLIGAFPTESVGSERMLSTITLCLKNMNCPICNITVQRSLKAIKGVEKAKADFKEGTAVIQYDANQATVEQLTEATTNAGYPAKVLKGERCEPSS